jgi:hypothetical protein
MTRSVAALFGSAALALTITAASGAEDADAHSANAIVPGCRDYVAQANRRLLLQGICAGIVEGISFMGAMVQVAKKEVPQGFIREQLCLNVPDEVTSEQVVRVAVAYIDARPARMHEPFPTLALEALRAAWPCR